MPVGTLSLQGAGGEESEDLSSKLVEEEEEEEGGVSVCLSLARALGVPHGVSSSLPLGKSSANNPVDLNVDLNRGGGA